MAEDTTKQEQQQEFAIHRLYTKDLSFEAPTAPKSFQLEWKPEVDINLDTTHEKIDDDLYDVNLQVTTSVKVNDEVVFIAEVKQSGIFMIKKFETEQLDELLGSFCPNILFPYAREVISDLVNRGGFPPLYLAPINFDAIYKQRKQQEEQKSA